MPMPQENRYTYADLMTWDEGERWELIDGYPMMMSSPAPRHSDVSGEIYRQIANYLLGKKCKAYHSNVDVRLFEAEGDRPEDVTTVVIPDVMIVCDLSKLDRVGYKGAPDMVVEVLSPSSLRHDRITKFNLYLRAGVREYWLVDPDNKSVQVFLLEDGRYIAKDLGAGKDKIKVNILDDCTIDLSLVFPE